MNEERPIVFTITLSEKYHRNCYISTKDIRGAGCEYIREALEGGHSHMSDLFDDMCAISEELNNKGYAVLFEVD